MGKDRTIKSEKGAASKFGSWKIWSIQPVIVLLIMAVVLSACNRNEVSGAENGSEDVAPSLKILSPLDGETITDDVVLLEVEIEGFVLDPLAIGDFKVHGRGHYHIFLDGERIATGSSEEFLVKGVPEGPHHLELTLANNDHSPLDSPVEASVIFDKK